MAAMRRLNHLSPLFSPSLLLLPFLLLAAGCGAISAPANVNAGSMAVYASKSAIDTTTTDQLSVRPGSFSSSSVHWSILSGQNDPSLGQGTVSADGLYLPPALLSRDSIQVQILATSHGTPAASATYSLTVTPGFVQVLTPETATLPPGGSVQVTGQIAEVNAGSIRWSLAAAPGASPGGVADLGDAYGSISDAHCTHSGRTYTSCTATYTAPRSLPAGKPSLFMVGHPTGNALSGASLHILLNGAGFSSSGLQNQAGQTGYVEMGSSGGNANDYDARADTNGKEYVNDCCGGTLGALVADRNDDLYILSNNHVLAESDQARPGDAIVQPALVDLNCDPQAGRSVGALRYVVPLQSKQSNVDAALAAATPAVDETGAILQLGPAINGSLSPAAPAAGNGETLTAGLLDQLQVVKSGRTTGLTCSTVDTVNLTVQVDYYYDCAETRPYYTKTYINQIGIPGLSFADSGDSGALVMDAANAQPIGLFFASGADNSNHGFSVANPIQDVLSELGRKSQAELHIAGGAPHPVTCSNYDEHTRTAPQSLSSFQAALGKAAAELASPLLMRPDNGILNIVGGQSQDSPGEAAVIVYMDRDKPNAVIPQVIDGVRTLIIPTDAASVDAGTAPTALPQRAGIHLSADVLRSAAATQQKIAPQLMTDPAFFGVGVTQSYDNPNEAALVVLVDLTKTPRSMPATAGGLRVRYMRVNRLHVTRSKLAPASRVSQCTRLAAH